MVTVDALAAEASSFSLEITPPPLEDTVTVTEAEEEVIRLN